MADGTTPLTRCGIDTVEIARVYFLSWMPFRPEPLHLLAILVVGFVYTWRKGVFKWS